MSALKRKGGIELGEDPAFQRREWVFERVSWVTLWLLMAAGLLGLFGSGLLSRTSKETPDGKFRVEYERFARRKAQTEVRVRVEAPARPEARVWVSRAYLHGVRVEEVSPTPLRVEAGEDHQVYVFPVNEGATRLHVQFRVLPDSAGSLSGSVGVGDASVEVSHFVYP
jgi:hypothetical protein